MQHMSPHFAQVYEMHDTCRVTQRKLFDKKPISRFLILCSCDFSDYSNKKEHQFQYATSEHKTCSVLPDPTCACNLNNTNNNDFNMHVLVFTSACYFRYYFQITNQTDGPDYMTTWMDYNEISSNLKKNNLFFAGLK